MDLPLRKLNRPEKDELPEADLRAVETAFRREQRLAMLWPVIAFLSAAGLLVALVLQLLGVSRWVDHTDVIIGHTSVVERTVADAQSQFRGYLLTGDDRLWELYRRSDRSVLAAIDGLQALVKDDPVQSARLLGVRADVVHWREFADQQVALKRSGAPLQLVGPKLNEGSDLIYDIRMRLFGFVDREDALRAGEVARTHAVTVEALTAALVLSLLLGTAVAFATARHMGRTRRRYRSALEAQARASFALREAEENLRLAKDAAGMGDWHFNPGSDEIVGSERFRELYGLRSKLPLSFSAFLAAIHPDDRDRVRESFEACLASRNPCEVEMRVPGNDGSLRWVFAKGEGVYDGSGQPVRMAGMAMDVTSRRNAEEAVRDADRRKDEFLGMLSHELRNPLAPIRNSVHVLQHANPLGEEAHRAQGIIARQVDHLARLVEDLLDVKRISSGKLRLRRQPLDLTRQVRETVEDMRPLFAKRGVSLDLSLPQAPVFVNADHTRLAQVVSNLLDNAVKFTDRGGHVSVQVEGDSSYALLRVRDDGEGIAPEMQQSVFEAFVQGGRTLERSRGGLGLGLSLVKGIAELHGGTVSVSSEGVGRGAEFLVRLPAEESGRATEVKREAPKGPRRRVLIIEDNLDAADSLRDVVTLMGGHEAEIANDGEAGLAAAFEHAPDVILCDLGLPTMDGYEVGRRLRAGMLGSAARLVALSGHASPDDVERALRAGFDHHLAKPADVDTLLRLIAEAPGAMRRAG